METLAIIPARGGSKGVPRKNLQPLLGRPLLEWTIEAARDARLVSRIVVSTDDEEIAATARGAGAEVVPRPVELSGDLASSEAALLHTLDHLQRSEAYEPDLVAFLQCTSPLTASEDIDGTLQRLVEEQADSAFAAIDFHYFVWERDSHGNARGVNHRSDRRLMRQERSPQFLEAGSVYAMKTAGFRKARHRFFGKTVLHEVPQEHHFEIDTPHDFVVAESLKAHQLRRQRTTLIPAAVSAVVFDFDGVFTDNRVVVSEAGRESVVCNRGDGLGLARLKASGIPLLVLSSEENGVVAARCRKLGIECLHGVQTKWPVLKQWLDRKGIDVARTVYVGNDLNDIECIASVGCGVAVNDAFAEVREAARLTLSAEGGKGAVREICELVLARNAMKVAA